MGSFWGGGTCPGPGCDHRTMVQPESGMSEVQNEALQGFLYSIEGRSHVDKEREECNVRGLERNYSHPTARPPLVLLHKHSTQQKEANRTDCLSHFQVKCGRHRDIQSIGMYVYVG